MHKLPEHVWKTLNDPEKEAQLIAEAASRRIDIRILLGVHWGLFSEQEASRYSNATLSSWIDGVARGLRKGQKIDAIRRALLERVVTFRRVRRRQRRSRTQVNPERAAAYRYMRAQLDSMSD